MTLIFRHILYVDAAVILTFLSGTAYADQPIYPPDIKLSAAISITATMYVSSPVNLLCEPALLAEPLATGVSEGECGSLLSAPMATASHSNLTTAPAVFANTPPAESISSQPQTDIVVTANQHLSKIDPLKTVNVKSFEAAQAADAAVLRPIAMAYKHVLPEPVRDGLHNFLGNIHEPVVALNYVFQLKPVRAMKTVARFAVNSTIGVAGLFDFAKKRPFKLRYHANGFADTLGFYGVKSGPFLYLPLIGPTTPRDLFGDIIDRSVIPLTLGKIPVAEFLGRAPYGTSSTVIRVLDRRIQFDETLRKLKEENASLYVARRRLYFRDRQTEIDNLHHPAKEN